MPPQPRKTTTATTRAKKTTAKKSTAKKTSGRKSATAGPTADKPTGPPSGSAGTGGAAGTTTKVRAAAAEGVEETLERIRELQERLLQAAKQNGEAYLDAYEKNLASMLSLTEKAAKSTNLDWAVALAGNYADFVKRINSAVIKASRSALS